ncbi:DUF2975 domain-containing protein [Pengzhenrongella phosphoraccumulans]|uniref:DUF2975 domain-containing protein n=1 Tax=Pengzhenrongella phosphoraccumulans TaxID=3114394 RepID=UPI00388E0E9F
MIRETKILRALLVMFTVGLVLAGGVLYSISLDFAAFNPELAHLRAPIYLAVVAGLVPTLVAVKVVFDLLEVVDLGESFSPRTVQLLRRLKLLFGITAAYLVLGFVGVTVAIWAAIGQSHPSIVLGWFAAEVVALFLFTLAALLERLFAAALELRQDNELTV